MTNQDDLQQTQLLPQQEENQDLTKEYVVNEGLAIPNELDEAALLMIAGGGDTLPSKGMSSLLPHKFVESYPEYQVTRDYSNITGRIRENHFVLKDTLDHKIIPGQ